VRRDAEADSIGAKLGGLAHARKAIADHADAGPRWCDESHPQCFHKSGSGCGGNLNAWRTLARYSARSRGDFVFRAAAFCSAKREKKEVLPKMRLFSISIYQNRWLRFVFLQVRLFVWFAIKSVFAKYLHECIACAKISAEVTSTSSHKLK
jgi:hypothetical protein